MIKYIHTIHRKILQQLNSGGGCGGGAGKVEQQCYVTRGLQPTLVKIGKLPILVIHL